MRTDELHLELPPRPASAAEARRFVARALGEASPRVREVGILLTSELVTNALLYAQGRIVVEITSAGDRYRVGVRDGSQQEVRPKRVGVEATSGRGLALVEQLAESWGVEMFEGDGKMIWFEVPRP